MNQMFKRLRKNNNSIQRINSYKSHDSIEFYRLRIAQLDKQILEATKIIFQAQTVRVRAMFSSRRNFLDNIQKNLLENSAE